MTPFPSTNTTTDHFKSRLFVIAILSAVMIIMSISFYLLVQSDTQISSFSLYFQSNLIKTSKNNPIIDNTNEPYNRPRINTTWRSEILRNSSAGETLCAYLRTNPNEPEIIFYNRMPKAGSSTMQLLYTSLSKTNNFNRLGTSPRFWLSSMNVTEFEGEIMQLVTNKNKKQFVIDGHWYQQMFNATLINRNMEYVQLIRDAKSWIKSRISYSLFDSVGAAKARRNHTFDNYLKGMLNINHTNYNQCFEDYSCLRNINIEFNPDHMVPFVCSQSCGYDNVSPHNSRIHLPTLNNPDTFVVIGVLSHLEKYLYVLECAYPNVLRGILDLFLNDKTHAKKSTKLNDTNALLTLVNDTYNSAVTYNKMYYEVEKILLNQYEYLKVNKNKCCRKQKNLR